ncbi:uncharacterized protein LOC135694881 isoform X1 [Rhopilema esculentum]|uniref:uncharacterized protein LOC135694881 isoform X1 n=1 Tax=Rhopilema esculentum TaxID=499914 RepID=UPI0031D9E4B2
MNIANALKYIHSRMTRAMETLFVIALAYFLLTANGMYLETPEDAVAKSDEQTRETSIETRSMRQWIRVDKVRYNCMDFRELYGCSCQFLFCNPGIRSCGSCAVVKPDKWKNAVTGKDCICYQAYQNYFYPSYYKK